MSNDFFACNFGIFEKLVKKFLIYTVKKHLTHEILSKKMWPWKWGYILIRFFFHNLAVNLNTPATCIMVFDNILSSFTIRMFLSPKYGDQEIFIAKF